ncbi:MAG: FAD-binding oxidoreductase [Candidatus Omnitrophica bacterium]|nr:FAD-binding oxidoreductase [Candidatus Omnitrophota bacterium]
MPFIIRRQNQFDVIVLGAGVAGIGVALELRREGLKVLVMSKRRVPGEASRAAAGILDPFLQIREPNHPLLTLTIPAFQEYEKNIGWIESETKLNVGYKKTGMIYAALSAQDEDELKRRFTWQKKTVIPVEWTSRGIHYPTMGRVYPHQYMDGLLALAKQLGVKFAWTDKAPIRFRKEKNTKIYVALSGTNTYESSALVNALGSWGRDLSLSRHFPALTPIRGQIVLVKSKKIFLDKILHNLEHHYVVPWDSHQYLIGTTTEKAGYCSRVTRAGVASIMSGVERFWPDIRLCAVTSMWSGLRPRTKDQLPVIGETATSGLYVAGGYYRSGILFGVYAGKLLAKSIVSGKIVPQLASYQPLRFTKKERLK